MTPDEPLPDYKIPRPGPRETDAVPQSQPQSIPLSDDRRVEEVEQVVEEFPVHKPAAKTAELPSHQFTVCLF